MRSDAIKPIGILALINLRDRECWERAPARAERGIHRGHRTVLRHYIFFSSMVKVQPWSTPDST